MQFNEFKNKDTGAAICMANDTNGNFSKVAKPMLQYVPHRSDISLTLALKLPASVTELTLSLKSNCNLELAKLVC